VTEAMSPFEALSLDCRGMKCPRPIIEIARRIGEVRIGALIELLADDPAAGPDLAAWCRASWYAASPDSKNSLPRRQGVSGLDQWKLSPQAHEPVALGLSMVKPCF